MRPIITTEMKRILAPLRREKLLVVSSILTGTLAAVLNLSRPVLLGYIISELVTGASTFKIALIVALFAFTWIMTWIISLFLRYLSSVVTQKTLLSLQLELLRHFLNLPIEKSSDASFGKLQAYTNSDLPVWVTLYGSTLAEVTHSVAQLIAAAITLIKLDPHLSSFIAPLLIASALIPAFTSRYMTRVSRTAQDGIADVLERLTSIIHGAKDLISFGAQSWALGRYEESCNRSYHSQVRRTVAQGALGIASSATEVIAYILVLAIGGLEVLRHQLNVGFLVSYLGTIEMIFYPARYSNELSSSVQNSWAAARRVWDFLDIPETHPRVKSAAGIQLREVEYTYPGAITATLKGVSCHIEKGKLIAIIGESGSGKSTLLAVLSGLCDPTRGDVHLIQDVGVPAAIVWQDPYLFSGTVTENMVLGEDIPLETIRQTATALNIDNTIMRLPSAYNSLVGHGGSNLSGGEKKRVALVRALLRNPGLIIMDEPTSGLDQENADMVWRFLEKLGPGVTRVITTHRLDEAKRADMVLVMKEGRLVEYGSPTVVTSLN